MRFLLGLLVIGTAVVATSPKTDDEGAPGYPVSRAISHFETCKTCEPGPNLKDCEEIRRIQKFLIRRAHDMGVPIKNPPESL